METETQGLSFGQDAADNVVSVKSLYPWSSLTKVLFFTYLVAGIALLIFFFWKNRKTWNPPFTLSGVPITAKAAVTLAMLSYGLVHILALLEVYFVTKVSFKSTSEYFSFMTFPKLAATSHAHFFGHGTMYLITSAVFIFSSLSERWKLAFITIAMSAGLLDVPSWWAIKYGGTGYEIFSAVAGAMSVLGWGSMALRIFYEFWWQKSAEGKI
jgi:hypothetical protein